MMNTKYASVARNYAKRRAKQIVSLCEARASGRGASAQMALDLARADSAKGEMYFGGSIWKSAKQSKCGKLNVDNKTRYVEEPSAIGLRFVGYADELVRLSHRGWYSEAFGEETFRGAVYALPGKNRKCRLLHGYVSSEEEGRALICFGDIVESESYADALSDAAYMADSLAENEADTARELSRAWHAGQAYAHNLEQIEESREALRQISEARRKLRQHSTREELDSYSKAMRPIVESTLERMAKLWGECEELKDGSKHYRDYSLAFYPGDKESRAAFNDGANAAVL